MLYPEISVESKHCFCTCGKPNFRNGNDSRKTHTIYKVVIPTAPYGSAEFHLCDECIARIANDPADGKEG